MHLRWRLVVDRRLDFERVDGREGRFPEAVGRLRDLLALPAVLGLPADTPRA